MIPRDGVVHLSSISGGNYIGIYVYKVNINGTIHEPDEKVVWLKDVRGETVASLTLIFVCQEIHPLSESRIEKADAQRLKEMLGDSVMKCREDFSTPQTLVEVLAPARISSR